MVKNTLLQVIRKTSAVEQKWLIRILLKDMKLHLGQKILLKEFHPDAESLYNVTTNLKTICEKLHDPSVRLAETEVTMFQPFKPMLASIIKITEVEKQFGGQKFQVEIKYDGERSQIHKDGEQYKYFSRNGNEYSTVFGETCYEGTLTKHIHACILPTAKTCILDGEMMAFDPNLKIFMQKGGSFDIKHVTEDSDFQPCFVAFDLLFLNGESTTGKTQKERFGLLESIVTPMEGRIIVAERREASTSQQVLQFLNEAIDRREEGIILKNFNSVYLPNKRKESGWFKVKPEYVDGVVDDLDLIIIGASFGTGRRANFLSMFHLAVAAENKPDSFKPKQVYKTFCRVGSGYTNKELSQIIEKLKPNLKAFEKRSIPPWLEIAKEKPEVIIHPDHSLVVQVRGTEIIPSTSYATNCTLRFPRIITLREDKSPCDALDFAQLNELRHAADGKLATKHAKLTGSPPSAKRRKTASVASTTIHSKFQGIDVSDVKARSVTFQGKTFCVLSGSSDNSKQDLERRIAENGGMVVQNPVDGLFSVIAVNERNIKVKNLIKSQKYDIVRLGWLLRCFEGGCLLPWSPSELIFATPQTQQGLRELFDEFGDDFTRELSEDSLREVFSRIDDDRIASVFPPPQAENSRAAEQEFVNLTNERLQKYDLAVPSASLFRGFRFYLPRCDLSVLGNARFKELTSLVTFYSGIFQNTLDPKLVTHVILDQELTNETTRRSVLDQFRQGQRRFRLIRSDWVLDCAKENRLLPENLYQV